MPPESSVRQLDGEQLILDTMSAGLVAYQQRIIRAYKLQGQSEFDDFTRRVTHLLTLMSKCIQDDPEENMVLIAVALAEVLRSTLKVTRKQLEELRPRLSSSVGES